MVLKLPKEKIYTFHKKDFEKMLKDLGMFEDFEKTTLKCHFCSNKISENNLFGFLKINKKIVSICNKVECSEKAIQFQIGEKQK